MFQIENFQIPKFIYCRKEKFRILLMRWYSKFPIWPQYSLHKTGQNGRSLSNDTTQILHCLDHSLWSKSLLVCKMKVRNSCSNGNFRIKSNIYLLWGLLGFICHYSLFITPKSQQSPGSLVSDNH